MSSEPDEGHAFDPEVEEGLTGVVVRGASLAAVGHFGAQALTFAAYLVLARLISPEEFGQFAAASVFFNAGLLFAESGMLAAVVHRRDRIEEAANTAVIATVLAGFGFGLLALAGAPLLGVFFDSHRIATLAAALSGALVLRALPIVPDALLARRFSTLRRVITEPGATIAFGIASIWAASNDLGPWALVIGYYATAITEAILAWALVRWRPHLRQASFAMWRELVSYGRHVVGGTAILRFGDILPTLLLGRFTGTAALGQYRYASRIAEAPFQAILATGSWMLFPAFARISDQAARFRSSFLRSVRAMATLGMPAGLILVPLGIPIAVIAFGSVWHDAGEATMALCLFAGAASLTNVSTEAFKAAGRPNLLVRAHTTAVTVGAIAMVALLPAGLVGVSAGFTVGALAGAGYSLARTREVIGVSFRDLAEAIAPQAFAAVVMAAVVWVVEHFVDAEGHATGLGVVLLGSELLLAGLVYVGVLLAISENAREEAKALIAGIRGLRSRVTRPGKLGGSERDALTTVVVPAYNSEDRIGATLRSVLAQTEPRLELLVVDDGSSDGTAAIVEEIAAGDQRVTLVNQANQGVAAARNTGIERATTPYVSFLDDDDLWMPGHLAAMAAVFESDPRIGFVNADGWVLDDATGRIRRAPFSANTEVPDPLPDDPGQLLVELAELNFIYGSVTARRSVLEEVGGFAPETTGSDDYDLWLRIATAGHLLGRPPGRLIVQRIRTDSQGHDWPMMLRRERKVLARLAANPDASEEAREVARRRLTGNQSELRAETATGPRSWPLRAKRVAGRLRRRALYNRQFYTQPPSEIREAFGDEL